MILSLFYISILLKTTLFLILNGVHSSQVLFTDTIYNPVFVHISNSMRYFAVLYKDSPGGRIDVYEMATNFRSFKKSFDFKVDVPKSVYLSFEEDSKKLFYKYISGSFVMWFGVVDFSDPTNGIVQTEYELGKKWDVRTPINYHHTNFNGEFYVGSRPSRRRSTNQLSTGGLVLYKVNDGTKKMNLTDSIEVAGVKGMSTYIVQILFHDPNNIIVFVMNFSDRKNQDGHVQFVTALYLKIVNNKFVTVKEKYLNCTFCDTGDGYYSYYGGQISSVHLIDGFNSFFYVFDGNFNRYVKKFDFKKLDQDVRNADMFYKNAINDMFISYVHFQGNASKPKLVFRFFRVEKNNTILKGEFSMVMAQTYTFPYYNGYADGSMFYSMVFALDEAEEHLTIYVIGSKGDDTPSTRIMLTLMTAFLSVACGVCVVMFGLISACFTLLYCSANMKELTKMWNAKYAKFPSETTALLDEEQSSDEAEVKREEEKKKETGEIFKVGIQKEEDEKAVRKEVKEDAKVQDGKDVKEVKEEVKKEEVTAKVVSEEP